MNNIKFINDEQKSELVVIGAPEQYFISDAIDRILAFLKQVPDAELRDVAFTSGIEAKGMAAKIAIVAVSVPDLVEKLDMAKRRILDNRPVKNSFQKSVYLGTDICPAIGRTVFLFPGEGSQYPDMLRDLTLHFPACRAAFDAADTAVASCCQDLGVSSKNVVLPSKWIFPTADSADAQSTTSLGMAPAILSVLAADNAMLFLFRQLGLAPDAVLGLGVGEIAALECSGAMKLPEKRNRIHALGNGFRMIAEISSNDRLLKPCATFSVSGMVKQELEAVLAQFGGKATIATEQAPELFTVVAALESAAEIEKAISQAGAATRRLKINKPFHTKAMKVAANYFRNFFSPLVTSRPEIPVYSCATGELLSEDPEVLAEAAASQWWSPLSIPKAIEKLYDDGYRVFVELGARGVLSTCVASTLRHKPHIAIAVNRGHRPDMLQFHHALAALVSHGHDLDVVKLHEFRSSQKLDFDHPGNIEPGQRARRTSLPQQLPVIVDIPIPKGLIAPAPIFAGSTSSPGSCVSHDPKSPGTDKSTQADSQGTSEFPMLNFAEIVKFSPGSCIDLSMKFSEADFPWFRGRVFGGGSSSAYSNTRMGLLVAPLEGLLEVMAEAARKLYPNKVVTSVSSLECIGLSEISDSMFRIRVQAKRLSKQSTDTINVDVSIFDQASFQTDAPEKLASSIVTLSDSYPASPPSAPFSLKAPIGVNWKEDSGDIYPARLFANDTSRAIRSVREIGENGLRAACVAPPRSSVVRSDASPRFSVSPIVLTSISDALGLFGCREPASGFLHSFQSCGLIEFFSPQIREWTRYGIELSAKPIGDSDSTTSANAEIIDEEGRILIKATGWCNRIIHVSSRLHCQLLAPIDGFVSEDIPPSSLPTLPQEVICCKIDDIGPSDDDDMLRLRIAANLALSPEELNKWNELTISTNRKREWLLGRIAAKDAVRKCLLARYGRRIGPADVRIDSDEAGKPTPQGEWRKNCGAQMDISITHTSGCVIAAAAPNASLGIDIENRGRTISEEFAEAAFSQLEQEIAAESGDGATTLLRFWCAKEALSKALGTGLRYGPSDLCARSFDQSNGRVEMEATKLWLKPFPHLRGMLIDVQTCLVGDVVLAVCALNPSMAKSESGPFIRWN